MQQHLTFSATLKTSKAQICTSTIYVLFLITLGEWETYIFAGYNNKFGFVSSTGDQPMGLCEIFPL